MKKIIFLISIVFGSQAPADETSLVIDCSFSYENRTIMTVITNSVSEGEVTEDSFVTFTGVERNVLNINNELADNEYYNFSLNEGTPEENIFIQVFKESVEGSEQKIKAMATNPGMPIMDKLEGFCSIK